MSTQTFDTSFLNIPRWTNGELSRQKAKAYWKQLTIERPKEMFWNRLSQLVHERAPESVFQELSERLCGWSQFVSESQLSVARTLVEVAQLAAKPEFTGDELERALLPNRYPWEWDAFCAFRGRSAERSVTVTALLVYQNNEGFTAKLTLERFENGTGGIYKSPAEHAFLTLAEDFEGAIDNAKACVKNRGAKFDGVDVRWRLERHDGKPLPLLVEGPSLGGAFAIGLVRLLAEPSHEEWGALELDGVGLTAAVDTAGNLSRIGGLWEKLGEQTIDLARRGLLHTVVVAAEQNNVPESYLYEIAEPLRVLKAKTVDDALKQLHDNSLPRRVVLQKAREECAKLDILGWKQVPMETHYQMLPLLHEVKREKLPRSEQGRGENAEHDDDERSRGRAVEVLGWEEEMRQEQVSYERHELKDLFVNFRGVVKEAKSHAPRFVVLGPPGSGKTTLEQYLAWQTALGVLRVDGRKLLPVRVRLHDWERWAVKGTDPEYSLPEYLAELHKEVKPAPTAEQWRRWLQRGDVLLLLDGLDEIAGSEQSFITALKNALILFPNCPTVLSCRTVSFEQHKTVCPDLPVFTLVGLDDSQRNKYISEFPADHPDRFDRNVLIVQLNRIPQMRPLASNPLLLSIICHVVDDPAGVQLPATRTQLYDKAVDKLLHRPKRVEAHYPPSGGDLPLTRKRCIIERAALMLFHALEGEQKLTFDERDLLHELQQGAEAEGYRADPAPVTDALLADLTQNSGILRGDADRGYFFLHLTIHEFLTACALEQEARKHGWEAISALVDKKAWLPTWGEVIVFLAGKLPDNLCERLLTLLTDATKDDLFYHRLALGVRCLPELPSTVSPQQAAIVNRITTDAFSIWWKRHPKGIAAGVLPLPKTLPALAQVNGRVDGIPLLTWLCEGLHDADLSTRIMAAAALGTMGASAAQHPDVLPTLVDVARRGVDEGVRQASVWALAQIGRAAAQHPDVLPKLVDALWHWSIEEDPLAAIFGLERMGASATQLPDVLRLVDVARRSYNNDVRAIVACTLGEMGASATQHPDVLPTLVGIALRGMDSFMHNWEAQALVGMGVAAAQHPDVLPLLVAALRDGNRSRRTIAGRVLIEMGVAATQHPDVLPLLVDVIRDRNSGMQAIVGRALGKMGTAAAQHPDVLPKLVAALRDENGGVRSYAAWALQEMGTAAAQHPDVLRTLVDVALRDEKEYVRNRATAALEAMGAAAAQHPDVLPLLVAALRDGNWRMRAIAARTLEAMGAAAAQHPDVLPLLVAALRDGNWRMRVIAARALGAMEAAAAQHSDVLPLLVAALRERSFSVRAGAVEALGRVGAAVAQHLDVLPLLVAALQDRHWRVRAGAVEALGRVGVAAAQHPDVLPALVDALRDRGWGVRAGAVEALGRMGATAAQHSDVLPALVNVLRDSDRSSVYFVVQSLQQMGATAVQHPDVLPALVDALQDADKLNRDSAADALKLMLQQGVRSFKESGKWVSKSVAELSQ